MSDSHTQKLFISAACFNFLAGFPFLVATRPVAELLGVRPIPTETMFIQVTMGVILLFGWAYWMVSRDPVRFRPYILLGMIGKILFVSIIFGNWLAGNTNWPFPAVASGDIIFTVLFWRYYRRTAA